MKDPKRRLRLTVALAIVFLVIYSGVLLFIERREYNDMIMRNSTYKADTVRSVIDGYKKTADLIGNGFWQEQYAGVRLTTIRLADLIVNGNYTGERFSGDSMVVRVRDGKVEVPPEAEGLFAALTPEMITDEYNKTLTTMTAGTADEALLVSGRIDGDWYYVTWVLDEVYKEYIMSRVSMEELLETQEFDDDIEIFSVDTGAGLAKTDEEGTILYKTQGLEIYDMLDDFGITPEDLSKDSFTIETEKGRKYICIPTGMDILGHTFVSCTSMENMGTAFIGDTVTQTLLATAMLIGLITWCGSVQWLVGRGLEDDEQKQRYAPKEVKKRATRLAIMSTLVVTVYAFLTVMMQCMYQDNQIGINSLLLLKAQVESAERNDTGAYESETERYERLGKTVSEMLTEDQALLKRENLSEIAEAIKAEYIIVFDENGNEIACSRTYKDFVLPTSERDPFSDFRRLLKGIPVVTNEPCRDFVTGETRAFVGVRYDYPEEDGKEAERFGAVLIALPSLDAEIAEDKKEDVVTAAKEQVYSSIQTDDRIILEIDPETHRIQSGSIEKYVGSDLEGFGIDAKKLKDRLIGFYRFDDEWYFGVSMTAENALYIYLTDSSLMSRVGILFAVISGVLFFIICILTGKFAMKEYTDENYEYYSSRITESADQFVDKIETKTPFLSSLANKWKNMTPEDKTKVILQFETGGLMLVLVLVALGDSALSRHSTLSFAMRGNWSNGLNLLSITAVAIVCCVGYLIFLVLKLIFTPLYNLASYEGDTVLGLIHSFLNYVLFIGTACMSLTYLGVDTVSILASLGIFSLAISLGAKDVVTDIIAGLSIILEKTYSVGDYIQIDDFKGKVLELGVRSTKVVNGTHDVKIISNHEISNVINYSRQTSVCIVRVKAPVTMDVNEIREMLAKELPEVKKNNPNIINGPKFDGIVGIEDDKMIISVSAEGLENHIYRIKLDLYGALQSMIERQLLDYAKPNLTIKVDGGTFVSTGTAAGGGGNVEDDNAAGAGGAGADIEDVVAKESDQHRKDLQNFKGGRDKR